jgi:hypothetical protein
MDGKRKPKKSRDSWKGKAIERGTKARYLSRENERLAAGLEDERKRVKVAPAIQSKEDLVYLSLKLYRDAGLGFRAVSRVLKVLTELLGFDTGVCPQSVINWVIRLAIVRIGCYVSPASAVTDLASFSNGMMWLIDLSIGLGSAKILTIIAIDLRHDAENSTPLLLCKYP